VNLIRPTARGVCVGGLTAVALPRPGHRSPVDSIAGRRESRRVDGEHAAMHFRQFAPRYGWFGGRARGAASSAVRVPPESTTAACSVSTFCRELDRRGQFAELTGSLGGLQEVFQPGHTAIPQELPRAW